MRKKIVKLTENDLEDIVKNILNKSDEDVNESLKGALLGGALTLGTMLGGGDAQAKDMDKVNPGIERSVKSESPIKVYHNGEYVGISVKEVFKKADEHKKSGGIVAFASSDDDSVAMKKVTKHLNNLGGEGVDNNDDVYKIIKKTETGYTYGYLIIVN